MRFLFLLLFAQALFSGEIDLSSYESSVYSRNGEDGVLAKLFQIIPVQSKFCVDCGSSDGKSDNHTFLLRAQGWKGISFDREYQIPKEHLFREFLTAENVNQIFEKYEVPLDMDLLSIDIGYNDFYLWKGLDFKYRPKVVVIGYNGIHPPDQYKVVKYRPFYAGDETDYYGASLLALFLLGRDKGYSLVYAESKGRHAFFVRDDLLTDGIAFKDMNDLERIYRPLSDEKIKKDDRERGYVDQR